MSCRRLYQVLSFILLISFMFVSPMKALDVSGKSDKTRLITFIDSTHQYGLVHNQCTFGSVFSDIDNDGDDDLIISNHGLDFPSIYLNTNGFFEDHSYLLPLVQIRDLHGIAAVDLDNDGDRDLVIACGGGDAVGEGCPNLLLRNLIIETGVLSFEDISNQVYLAGSRWRGRHFLPLASPDGATVDLYLVCKQRPETTNIYFSNRSAGEIILEANASFGLNRELNQEGRGDLFFDYDRDGDQDLLLINMERIILLRNDNGRFAKAGGSLRKLSRVTAVQVGDLNNDGYPDLYIGTRANHHNQDNISVGRQDNLQIINFVLYNNVGDNYDRFDFRSNSSEIYIDLIVKRGFSVDDPSDIYIGRYRRNPRSRIATITALEAEGQPALGEPGVYIWNDGAGRWSFLRIHGDEIEEERGRVSASSIYEVELSFLEKYAKKKVTDYIYINHYGRRFKKLESERFEHEHQTRAVTIFDFNNDGWLDIIGIRGSEPGAYNGEPFVILNRGNLKFRAQKRTFMRNSDDDISQANTLIAGFVDADGLPDLFMTNGYGVLPSFIGPYKLYINTTKTNCNYVLLELSGTSSNSDALGAQISLYTRKGKLLGYRELGSGYNVMQSTHKVHFGLGDYSGILEARITWPNGNEQSVRVRPNKVCYIRERR